MDTSNKIRDERRGLLYRYTRMLYTDMPIRKVTKGYFTSDTSTIQNRLINHQKALILFHFAYEIFLRWDKEYVRDYTDRQLLEKMKLYEIYTKYIIFPIELDKTKDYWFLAHLLYDRQLKEYDHEKYVLKAYNDILEGNKYKSIKGFFSDEKEGQERACICLREMIRRFESFSSLRDMYEYFASAYGVRDLEKYGFKNHWRAMFGSPVAFLHMALPVDERNDFLFHYYNFQYWFDEEARKKRTQAKAPATTEKEDSKQ